MNDAGKRSWQSISGAEARGFRRPDGRWLVQLPMERRDAWEELAECAARDTRTDLLVTTSGDLSA